MQNEVIKTTRLKLIPLSPDQLSLYIDKVEDFSTQIGPVSRRILTDDLRRAISMKLERLASDSKGDTLWITYWLIQVPPDDFGAGMIGYKGAPDDKGQVEIGYGMDQNYQNMGYTTEALEGLIQWAFGDPRCKRIVAPDTPRTNIPSNRVLQKVGMQVYEEKADSFSWCLERDWG
jgi:RimJ/RimL family protein N-acetyltransferase